MRLLILGGTRFVGRAVVEAALADGIEVTTLNRGLSGPPADGITVLTADRTDPAALRAALDAALVKNGGSGGEWDAVIDTWSGAPRTIAASCELLRGRIGHFGYVSTVSVYADPLPMNADEHAATVDEDPDSPDDSDYQLAKRGSELAVQREFGDEVLIARPGLILGPYENVGRLPWWLRRIERGGQVLAPGDPAGPVQYVDARDLARWLLDAARAQLSGVFNVVGKPGSTTLGELLGLGVRVIGSDAELVWAPQELILRAGISPWTELPIWLPRDPEYDAMVTVDASAAYATGLRCGPVQQTVADTWAWLQAEGDPPPRPDIGLDPAKEQEVLDTLTSG
jgi:2'-hydroxyisoflavone reductase